MDSTVPPQMELPELESRLIYAVIVAGKSAQFTDAVMPRFAFGPSPFDSIRGWVADGCLGSVLKETRAGNYTKLEKCLRELVASQIDIRTCTPEQLERIHGIGLKTSRFFILKTRSNVRYAALDVHVLRWLRAQGYDAPRSTPNGRKYRELEKIFLSEADKRGLSPGDLDAKIWDAGSKYSSPLSTQGDKESCN